MTMKSDTIPTPTRESSQALAYQCSGWVNWRSSGFGPCPTSHAGHRIRHYPSDHRTVGRLPCYTHDMVPRRPLSRVRSTNLQRS